MWVVPGKILKGTTDRSSTTPSFQRKKVNDFEDASREKCSFVPAEGRFSEKPHANENEHVSQ